MKLFEYMASGVPVVASDVGEQVSQVIQDEKNGLLVEPGNRNCLASVINRLIGSPELRFLLGAQARKDAVDKYSWDHYVERLERLYISVLEKSTVSQI